MPLTVLFDLDDTLLINPLKPFMQGYLNLLSQHLAPYVSPDAMVRRLIAATNRMVEKTQSFQTLEMVFDEEFYPSLGVCKQDLHPIIMDFYVDVFPSLKKFTSQRPDAINAVENAFASGYQVVVATNPLFPAIATSQRLEWAGLPQTEYPFDLVTSYESMHFAKPNSAYFTEILAQLGWPDNPVCMIGNYYEHDIQPLHNLGIPGFLIKNGQAHNYPQLNNEFLSGDFENLQPWFSSLAGRTFAVNNDHSDAIMAILRSTAGALVTLTRQITQSQWASNHFSDSEGIPEILTRFDNIEIVNKSVLSSHRMPSVSSDREEKILQACQNEILNSSTSPNETIIDFYFKRSVFLENLDLIGYDRWRDEIDHPIFGRITLLEWINRLALSDRLLLHQIKQIIDHSSSQYLNY